MRGMALMVLLAAGLTVSAHGATRVDVRLVRAYHGWGVSRELRDVADLLRGNLPYTAFEMLSRASVPIPNRGQNANLSHGLSIHVSGNHERLSVLVQRQRATLLRAVVGLRPNVPIILGGFPDKEDRLLIVLVAR